ncbi:LysR family transcriptional regulator [Roseibium sp. RKSG952]|uniref:LysR family transcriptional regulator n=1 Tax=Roseibium sp. RKSG952 TaxID=2529384 RepID=UPI0012BD0A2B|nr:LysR family transcriptional regulator [Roseibium sp. RKSG952]MTH98733.1 LysR family transcriptional regulator [Roseibium sp. RKSG952]
MPVAPPRPKPLPLNALRAFEAAARLGGFSSAAIELGVSAGAISAHVKALEEDLGAPLFDRNARGVALTALGQKVLPDLTLAFDMMGQATQTLRTEARPQVVHIVTLPSIAQLWLSPRLPELRLAEPEIEVSLTAEEAPPNLKRAPYDIYLFFGGELGEAVSNNVIFPVCAPALANRLKTPEDLSSVTCLSDSTWFNDWQQWTSAAMPEQGFAPKGPVFSLYALAVEEALNGAGVLMGHSALVEPHLKSGRLVAPFETKVTLPDTLNLWCPRPLHPRSPVERVVRWLKGIG